MLNILWFYLESASAGVETRTSGAVRKCSFNGAFILEKAGGGPGSPFNGRAVDVNCLPVDRFNLAVSLTFTTR